MKFERSRGISEGASLRREKLEEEMLLLETEGSLRLELIAMLMVEEEEEDWARAPAISNEGGIWVDFISEREEI